METAHDISRITQILQISPKLRSEEDIAYLMALTSKIDFFRKITEEQKSSEIHKACCQVMTFEKHNPGHLIVNFGEKGSNFYIVLKGSASVNIPRKKKVTISLRDLETDKLKKIISMLHKEEDDISEIKFDPQKRRRRGGRIYNAVDLISLNSAMQEKENEESDNQQLNELYKINDLFQDKLDEEKAIILDFLSKQNPEARVVEIETEDLTKASIINEGGSFGESALISNKPRAATLIAEEKIILGVISKPSFKKIVENLAEKKLNEVLEFLQASGMFSNWSKIALYKLGPYFSRILYKKNQFVYKEGEPANTVYFVKSGEFKITKIHSELKGVVDTSSLETKNNRISSSVLRLGQMRKIGILKQLQLVIKGKNEIIGMEEVMENSDKRIHSCQCWSDEGELLCISRDKLSNGITSPDTWAQLRDKHSANNAFFKERVIQLIKIEEAKKSLDLTSFSKLPIKCIEKEKEEIEKLKESPNIMDKTMKETKSSSPDKEVKCSSWFISPKHRKLRSLPSPSPSPYPSLDKVKIRDSPVFKEDRSILFYNRIIGTGISNFDSPKAPKGFTIGFKERIKKKKQIVHRRVAPPNFLRNYKQRASSWKADNITEELAAKFKDYVNRSLRKYSE
ncbi:RAPGEFL1 [Blepharisma stoltei]|uniref:Cyclic nucleotide-binding domain-containing protein n=1 Tax=Blepharisma stoltei TaxID=1481888 RepID=A0AAU9IHF1_9CILI|nr:unnamed protein product [Blepharisma stoltei]